MAKEKNVTLVNSGVCSIFIKGDRYVPGDEIEVLESDLETSGIEMLIARGDLKVKNDEEKTEAVKARVSKRKKASPTEGKTKSELEDGGEF